MKGKDYEYSEIVNMYRDGIELRSGVKLSTKDLYDIQYIFNVRSGMDSYEYVREDIEDIEDDENEYPDITDLDVFDEINSRITEIATGADEYRIVKEVLNKWSGKTPNKTGREMA